MSRFSLFLVFLLCSGGFYASSSFALQLTAEVDRTVINMDESLQLSVKIDQQIGAGGPDFSELGAHFEIVNQSRNNQFRSFNGRSEGWTEWSLILVPKKSGSLLIPSFSFEGVFSDAIPITVKSLNPDEASQDRDVFLTVEPDKTSLYVQEQLLVRVKFHTSVALREYAPSANFTVDNALVEQVNETVYRKTINERTFEVKEITYAVYPQTSGTVTIPEQQWVVVLGTPRGSWNADPFAMSRGVMRRLRSEAQSVSVQPKPTEYSGAYWLPAENVTLEQHWSSDPSRFVVGEPITRTITIAAQGLTAEQIAPLPDQTIPGIRVYSDQPRFDNTKSQLGVTGNRIESVAIMPTQPGQLTLPALKISWWDTVNKTQRESELPAQLLQIAPAAAQVSSTAATIGTGMEDAADLSPPINITTDAGIGIGLTPDSTVRFFWYAVVLNMLLAILVLVFFIAWLRARNTNHPIVNEPDESATKHLNQYFHEIRRACSENNATAVRNALGHWGQAYWQLPHFASLQEIGNHCGSKRLVKALAQLDKILYGTDHQQPWDGKELWQLLVEFKQRDGKHKSKPTTELAPLYPA